MSKHMDIIPPKEPQFDYLSHSIEHLDDLLLTINWTLDTYTNLPREQRTRLEEYREGYEYFASKMHSDRELIRRLSKGWS